MRTLASIAFALLASCSPALAQSWAGWSPRYKAAVVRYRTGEADPEVSEVCGWSTGRLRREVSFGRGPGNPATPPWSASGTRCRSGRR